jgi:hypothetical protein
MMRDHNRSTSGSILSIYLRYSPRTHVVREKTTECVAAYCRIDISHVHRVAMPTKYTFYSMILYNKRCTKVRKYFRTFVLSYESTRVRCTCTCTVRVGL